MPAVEGRDSWPRLSHSACQFSNRISVSRRVLPARVADDAVRPEPVPLIWRDIVQMRAVLRHKRENLSIVTGADRGNPLRLRRACPVAIVI